MENAGRAVSDVVSRTISSQRKVLVLCGKGNNGADGMVAARHLSNRGFFVRVLLCAQASHLSGEVRIQWNLLTYWKIFKQSEPKASQRLKSSLQWCDVIVDGLLGVGLKHNVRSPISEWIQCVNDSKKNVIAIDIPSGIDADSGAVRGVAICAYTTVSFHAPKKGLLIRKGPQYSGKIIISDISLAPSFV
jgi:NAD(P)H-hydrate epimerase